MVVVFSQGVIAQRTTDVGLVAEVEGEWFLTGESRPLKRAERVPAGGRVIVKKPSRYDYIVIIRRNGELLARRDCSRQNECNVPIVLPALHVRAPSIAEVLIDTVIELMWGKKYEAPAGGVRGGALREAVLRLHDGKLDLAPAFKTQPYKRFCVRFRSVPRGDEPPNEAWLGPFEEDNASAVALPITGGGLFEIEIQESVRGKCEGGADAVWVLVTESNTFQKASESFRHAVELTDSWGEGRPGPETKRRFLRAYLERLTGG